MLLLFKDKCHFVRHKCCCFFKDKYCFVRDKCCRFVRDKCYCFLRTKVVLLWTNSVVLLGTNADDSMKLRFKFNSDNVHASKNPHHTDAKVAATTGEDDITSPVCPETREDSVLVVYPLRGLLPW